MKRASNKILSLVMAVALTLGVFMILPNLQVAYAAILY